MPASYSDLFKWLTEEMGFLPCKVNGANRDPIDCKDLEFLFQGHAEYVWNHIIKHVRSAMKVDNVRKNILLNRVKSQQKMPEIQKNDFAGNFLNEMHESSSIRSNLMILRKKIVETEEKVKQLTFDLKIAVCKCQHLSNDVDNMERRNCLLEMANETAGIKADAVLSSKENLKMERADQSSVCDVPFIKKSRDGTIIPVGKLLDVDMTPRVNRNCKEFLDRCDSIASEMINERVLNVINKNHFGTSTPLRNPVDVSFSNYLSFVGFNNSDLNDSPDRKCAKESDLRIYISQNIIRFTPKELFEALIQQTSQGITDVAGLRMPRAQNLFTKFSVLDSEDNPLEKLNDMLSEEKININYNISQDFVAVVQDKVMTAETKNVFKSLMSEVEFNLKEVDLGMFEKSYELVELLAEDAHITGMISSLEYAMQRMQMDLSNKKAVEDQLMKIVDQLKEISREKVHQSETKEVLLNIRKEIQSFIFSNHDDVQRFLNKIKFDFWSESEDLEMYNGLLSREIKAFIDFPLECRNRTTISSGTAIPDSQLLLSGFNFNKLKMNGKELEEAFGLWVKCTMGLAPFSSMDAIFLAAVRMKESLKQLRSSKPHQFFINNNNLRSEIEKIPEQLIEIDADKRSWDETMRYWDEISKKHVSMISHNLKETEYIYHAWSKGVLNKYVPENVQFDGKDYKKLYDEVQAMLMRK